MILRHAIERLDRRIILILLSLLAVLWLQAPRLGDEFQVDEDFRSFYWMAKLQDPALFPNDEWGGHRYVNVHLFGRDFPLYFRSLGYEILFAAASLFVTPVLFSKLLPFFLMPLTVWYLFKFGKLVHGPRAGTVLAVGFIFLNLASRTSISIIPGLQRSFACSLMIILVYYLSRRKAIAAAVIIFLSALIYPLVFLLAVATWGLFLLKVQRHPSLKLSVDRRGFGILLSAFLLGALIMSPALFSQLGKALDGKDLLEKDSGTVGKSHTRIWEDPQYNAGGSSPLFTFFPFIGRGGLVNKGTDAVHLIVLSSVAGLIFLFRGHRAFDFPDVIWCVLWASLILFILSWMAIWLTNSFLLYLPSRYTRVGLFLFLFYFVFLNGKDLVAEAINSIRRNRRTLMGLIGGIEIVVLLLVFLYPVEQLTFYVPGVEWSLSLNMKWILAALGFVLGILAMIVVGKKPALFADLSPRTKSLFKITIMIGVCICWAFYAPTVSRLSFLDPPDAERRLLKFLGTLPKDILLGGTPSALDNVPLFAKRQILFSRERLGENQNLIRQALHAYYSDDENAVFDFCRAHDVDYLVIDQEAYSAEHLASRRLFLEPYNQELLSNIGHRETFILARLPDQAKVFQAGELFVVPCRESVFHK